MKFNPDSNAFTSHLFLNLVKSLDDPFYGIKQTLKERGETNIFDEFFSSSSYQRIKSVEYTWKIYLRPFYYVKVFAELRAILFKYVNHSKLLIYISDEGFWPRFILDALSQKEMDFLIQRSSIVNIQHGYFDINTYKNSHTVFLKKIYNAFSRLIFGYTPFGFGFGKGNGISLYLVYSNYEKEFLIKRGIHHNDIISASFLIKKKLIDQFDALIKKKFEIKKKNTKQILFVLPYFLPGVGPTIPLGKFLDIFHKLFNELVLRGFTINLRFHPGMDLNECRAILKKSIINELVDVDCSENIADSLSSVSYVLGFNSTMMYEAYILGLVPVVLINSYYPKSIYFLHEEIDIELFTDKDIIKIFNIDTINVYSKNLVDSCKANELLFLKKVLG